MTIDIPTVGDQPTLAEMCARHRAIARAEPLGRGMLAILRHDPRHMQPYSFRWGKFHVELTYATLVTPPVWHASVSILEDIAELSFGDYEQALLGMESWTNDDMRQAKEILGECLAPEILTQTQPVDVHKGLFSLHMTTAVQGDTHERSRIIVTH